jgi:hypothetical protein
VAQSDTAVVGKRTNGSTSNGNGARTAAEEAGLTKERAIPLVQAFLADGILTGRDLARFVPTNDDPHDPESLRRELEVWFTQLGIELVTGRPFSLGPCPFTREELEQADRDGWLPLVSPKGLTLKEASALFRFDSWAIDDPLVTSPAEEEDLWFLVPKTATPAKGNVSGQEARKQIDEDGHVGFSLQRYMIFAARMQFLTGDLPDHRWWVWILRGRYDRSGFMIVGFDPNGRFSVHAWMPSFRAAFVGHRPLAVCERIAEKRA